MLRTGWEWDGVTAFDLVPADGARPGTDPHTWHVTQSHVHFESPTPLAAGWYRLRLAIRSHDHFGVRKRAELYANDQKLESFEWNRELREDLIIFVPTADQIRVTLHHANGTLELTRFQLTATSTVRTAARAVRAKLKLLASYHCFWPVVRRGGALLAKGNWREFRRRVLKGLGDSRTMRIEVKRAAEASAMWWRRRTLSAEQLAVLRAEADTLENPSPIGVLLPVDPTRVDHARQVMLSVFRQAYPHWQLRVAWPTPTMDRRLTQAANWDNRTRIVVGRSMRDAVERALTDFDSDHVLVLPPDWELAEFGLLHLAQHPELPELQTRNTLCAALSHLHTSTAVGVVRWANSLRSPSEPQPFFIPLDDAADANHAKPLADRSTPLVLAADVRGLTGWDHVAFAILKGLRSLGIPMLGHHAATVVPELLPPRLQLLEVHRRNHPQLAIAPPFLLGRFGLDSNTAVLTMWETDHVEPRYVQHLNRAAVIMVPSQWSAETFRKSGVTAPIEVVPLGYDPLVFHPHQSRPSVCTFGTAGALSAGGVRKNVRRVIDLFRQAFPTETDVRLRVKITPNCPPLDVPDDPRLDVVRDSLPYAELAAWNRSLTAYVNASFAEGFGFHLLEAMACGVPLISPHYSGLTAFFDDQVGYVVPHRIVSADNAIYSGRWADPDNASLIDQMRRVYCDRAEAAAFGDRAAARARRFTWRDTGRAIHTVLQKYHLVVPLGSTGGAA